MSTDSNNNNNNSSSIPSLQSLKYSNDGTTTNTPNPKLEVLDQLLIPQQKVYMKVTTAEEAFDVIRNMNIRGAPLIAIVALLGLSVDLYTNPVTIEELDGLVNSTTESSTGDKVLEYIRSKMNYLKSSRPTAVNLTNALGEVDELLVKATNTSALDGDNTRDQLCKVVLDYSEFMLKRDVSDNKAIGKYGADAVLKGDTSKKVNMVTICNTGSLATAGYGTALGVVRHLAETDNLASITALETRPYNQGSRLTAFEIVEEQMPGGQLICDSSAGALMQTKKIDGVVVGADRVCANGDTANKIGTYNLSIIAKFHNVPFFVASPVTSIDPTLATGDEIPIEERSAAELLETSKAPSTIQCWNPAFDVTPASNITGGIITEKGLIEPDVNGNIDVKAFLAKHASK